MMPRRSVRFTYKVTVRQQIRYRVERSYVPLPAPRLVPRLTSTRTLQSPFASIREAADDYAAQTGLVDEDREYDVFVSHASEDQAEVVRPLVTLLEGRHLLKVWYSEAVLRPGMSIRRSIDAGLRTSRFGVVVLSQSFFAKEWPNRELDGLVTRSVVEGRQLILPIWHNVSTADVTRYSAPLADKMALSTTKSDLSEIAREIAAAVAA